MQPQQADIQPDVAQQMVADVAPHPPAAAPVQDNLLQYLHDVPPEVPQNAVAEGWPPLGLDEAMGEAVGEAVPAVAAAEAQAEAEALLDDLEFGLEELDQWGESEEGEDAMDEVSMCMVEFSWWAWMSCHACVCARGVPEEACTVCDRHVEVSNGSLHAGFSIGCMLAGRKLHCRGQVCL